MFSNILTIGDKINLTKITNSNQDNRDRIQYVSTLLDFINESKAKIAMPIYSNRIIPLDLEDKYQLCFYTNRGLYQCKGVITDRYKEENLYVLEVQFTSDIEKYQRREFYRLACILDIEYRVVPDVEMELTSRIQNNEFKTEDEKNKVYDVINQIQNSWEPAIITDISGGGARFNSKIRQQKGEKLRISITFHISEGTIDYELKANVISSDILPNRLDMFENRVEFSEIESGQRESIIKYVFEEERKNRKRERGIETL